MFNFFKKVLSKTHENLVNGSIEHVELEEEFDDFILDEMEEVLIKSDLGVNVTCEIVDKLRKKPPIKPSQVRQYLKDEFLKILDSAGSCKFNYVDNALNIYFITGVNGAGKTTLIGKLAYRLKKEGKKVLVAAADTFRAAAEEQLNIWTQRAGAQIVRKDGADPSSVVFEAITKAKNENFDVVLIDTAGRLQNKFNLMEELSKIKSVIDKIAPQCLRECILVLDANTGQNGLQQAKTFAQCVNLTSVALTKLDGSAKGAIIIAIAKELGLPVKLVGTGEKIEDLEDFNPEDFLDAILN